MASRGVTEAPVELFRTSTATVGGVEYQFRELSVKENEACVTAARASGEFDGRIMMKFMVLKSVIDPKLTDVSLGDMPQRLYLKLCDVVSELNADDEVEAPPEGEDPNR